MEVFLNPKCLRAINDCGETENTYIDYMGLAPAEKRVLHIEKT
jgi:hypothetical protein